jgi:hypothetical protein
VLIPRPPRRTRTRPAKDWNSCAWSADGGGGTAVRLRSPMHRLSPMTLIASAASEAIFEINRPPLSARSDALIAIKGPSIGCR